MAEAQTWVVVTRILAQDAATDAARALLEEALPVALRVERGSLRANLEAELTYDLGLNLVRAGRLEEGLAALVDAREGADSWIWEPRIALLSTRIARLQGRWEDGLVKADHIFNGDILEDRNIAAMADPPAAYVEIRRDHLEVRGLTRCEVARLQAELGRLDRAAHAAVSALELSLEEELAKVELEARLVLASLSNLRRQPEQTLSAVDEIVERGLAAEDAAPIQWLRGMGAAALEVADADRPPAARGLLEAALATDELDPIAAFEAEWMLSELDLAAGALDDAQRALDRAQRRLESWGQAADRLGTRALRLVANRAELACRRTDTADSELRAVADDLAVGFETLIDSWAHADFDAGGVGFLETDERRAVLGELVRVLARLDGDAGIERALGYLLRAQAMGTVARSLGTPPGTLEDLRSSLLTDGGGVLVYVVTSSAIHLIAIDARELTHHELESELELRPLTTALTGVLRRPPPFGAATRIVEAFVDDVHARARALGRELVPDELWPRIDSWSSAAVIGTEVLGGLPLEVLMDADGRLFGERLPLCRLPSIPLAVASARGRVEPPPTPRTVELLAHLQLSAAAQESFGELSSVDLDRATLERLLKPYRGVESAVLLTPPPTPTDFRAAFDRSAVLQILAHGIFDPQRELGAGILLSDADGGSGALWHESLDDLARRPRGLVLVTSCSTAIGPRRTGDDRPAHLAGAMLAAGASGVISTPEQLELELALDLSRLLHRRLAAGDSAAEALRSARAALGAGDPLRALSLARLQLVGLPTSPLPPPPPRAGIPGAWFALGATLAALIGAATALRKRRAARHSGAPRG